MNPLLRYPILILSKAVVWVFGVLLIAVLTMVLAVLTLIEAAWNNEPIRKVWRRQTNGLYGG